jgi:hypothetical protein
VTTAAVLLGGGIVLAQELSGESSSNSGVRPVRVGNAKIFQTPSGIQFGILGGKERNPAPTLFVLSGDMKNSLENPDLNTVGWILSRHGFISVSLDIPCHGDDEKPDEPKGVRGWRARLEKGENFLTSFQGRFSHVVDFLVQEGYSDPQRIGVCGNSRGGFVALHAGAADHRVSWVVAFAPVTDLLSLVEFQGMQDPSIARPLDTIYRAESLASKAVWITIGHDDERVGTLHAIELARKVMELSPLHKELPRRSNDRIKLVLTPSAFRSPPRPRFGGHSDYDTDQEEAAAWILRWSGRAR